jgi:hypothetical protein
MGIVDAVNHKLVLALCSAAWLLGCAGSAPPKAEQSVPGIAFKADERAAIERYYAAERRRPAPAPAALYKPGDRLDSGSRPQPLPSALKVQLADPPPPYTRLVVGADVILVNRDSHVIADVVPAIAY